MASLILLSVLTVRLAFINPSYYNFSLPWELHLFPFTLLISGQGAETVVTAVLWVI